MCRYTSPPGPPGAMGSPPSMPALVLTCDAPAIICPHREAWNPRAADAACATRGTAATCLGATALAAAAAAGRASAMFLPARSATRYISFSFFFLLLARFPSWMLAGSRVDGLKGLQLIAWVSASAVPPPRPRYVYLPTHLPAFRLPPYEYLPSAACRRAREDMYLYMYVQYICILYILYWYCGTDGLGAHGSRCHVTSCYIRKKRVGYDTLPSK